MKTATTEAVQVGDGFQYTIGYQLLVTNEGDGPGTYDLIEAPLFAPGVTIDSLAVSSAQLPGPIDVAAPVVPIQIANDEPITAGDVHTWNLTYTVTIPAGLSATERDCVLEQGENGTGGLNTATVDPSIGDDTTDDICVVIPDPEITTVKTVASGPTFDSGTGEYTITYDVVTTNDGEGPGTFTMVDDPEFGDGVDIVTVGATSSDFTVDPGFAAPGGTVVADEPLAAGASKSAVITITFTVAADITAEARDCVVEGNETGSGTLNTVTVTPNIGDDSTSEDCGQIPAPGIGIVKTVVGGPVQIGTGFQYSVDYMITVTNTGASEGTYDLDELPTFAAGVTIDSTVVTSDQLPGSPVTDPTNPIVVDEPIGVDETHTYDVTVTFTVPADLSVEARDCEANDGQGEGTGALKRRR